MPHSGRMSSARSPPRRTTPSERPEAGGLGVNEEEREELEAVARGRPDIRVVDEYFSHADKEATIALCDCYVSLHRSEGFGLTMAEAMPHGKAGGRDRLLGQP
jgi:hypothetical protein